MLLRALCPLEYCLLPPSSRAAIIAIYLAIYLAISVARDEVRVMTKVVSVSEAKNSLSAVLDWAVENDDGVIIEFAELLP